jgi:hypothetical protein
VNRGPLLAIAALAAIGTGIWAASLRHGTGENPFRRIESSLALNEAQKGELLKPHGAAVEIYRFKSPQGLWQVSADADAAHRPGSMKLGRLFASVESPEVSTPVYLCSYSGFAGQTTSLDLDPGCTGEGHAVQAAPLGYLSPQIRTGYLMMVRCRNASAGFYPSLNPRCEDANDRIHGSLGAILAGNQ